MTPGGDCPKSMTFGPCGGVRGDGSCEVGEFACPFLANAATPWPLTPFEPRQIPVPRIIVDHRPTGDENLDLEILELYRDLGVTVLLGDHLDDPPSTDRAAVARFTIAAGVATIASVSGRSRSAMQRGRLIDDLVDADVAALLCVTGDHPAARFSERLDVKFTGEGTTIAGEARRSGAVVAVAESPTAPPGSGRAHRLVAKQRAGADFVILNHAGTIDDTFSFAASCRDLDLRLPLVAAVPVMTDRRSIEALTQFPGVVLPADSITAISGSADPQTAGVEVAADMTNELLADRSIVGVNLSGIATGEGPRARAEIMSRVVEQLAS